VLVTVSRPGVLEDGQYVLQPESAMATYGAPVEPSIAEVMTSVLSMTANVQSIGTRVGDVVAENRA
jgi:hypothetical protein